MNELFHSIKRRTQENGRYPDPCCAGGGIGRRAGFRSLCPFGCVGSSPTRRTKEYYLRQCREDFSLYAATLEAS